MEHFLFMAQLIIERRIYYYLFMFERFRFIVEKRNKYYCCRTIGSAITITLAPHLLDRLPNSIHIVVAFVILPRFKLRYKDID